VNCGKELSLGRRKYCSKKCKIKEYYKENKDKIKEYYKENKDKIKEYYKENKDKIKEYYKENKDKIKECHKEYRKEKYSSDINFKIKNLLRGRLREAMSLYTKEGKITSSKYMGIHWNLVIKHLIKRMPEDIDKREYHIDHIIPLCKFNLEDPDEIKVAFAPGNHQWLLAKDNLSKGGKYDFLT